MFDILSIIFIIIIAISAIIGFKKGLVSTLIGFAKGVVSIIVGCLLAKPVGTILNNSSLGEKLINKLTNSFEAKDAIFKSTFTNGDTNAIADGLDALKIPSFLQKPLLSLFENSANNSNSITLGNLFGQTISLFVFIIIAFLLITIIIYLLMLLLNRFLMNINKVPVLGFINRLGGIVFGAAIALLFLSGVCMIFSMLIPVSDSIGNFLTETLKLNSEDTTFAKIIYEYNLIGKLLEALF